MILEILYEYADSGTSHPGMFSYELSISSEGIKNTSNPLVKRRNFQIFYVRI